MSIKENMDRFFTNLEQLDSDKFMKYVELSLDDEEIERCAQHIEDFYGIDDDEELGILTQIFITGVLLGLEAKQNSSYN